MNVGERAANDCSPPRHHGSQRENIGAGPIEDGENLRGSPKVFPNDLTQSSGVLVFAVGHLVTDVGVCERYQNFGVHPGVVVAGKAPPLGVMESHETILTGLLGVCAEACDAGGRRDCRAEFLCQSLIKHRQRELIVVNLICDLARGSLERNIAGEKP